MKKFEPLCRKNSAYRIGAFLDDSVNNFYEDMNSIKTIFSPIFNLQKMF